MQKKLMRKTLACLLLVVQTILPFSCVFLVSDNAQAAQQTATINFDTSQTTAIQRNYRGYNDPMISGPMQYLDEEAVNIIKDANVGWIRFGGGANAYNWKLGEPDDESIVQYYPEKFYDFHDQRRNAIAKGTQQLKNYYEMSRRVGAKIIMTLNVFTELPRQIGDLAKYVKDNNIQVEYWQLGNEPYWFGWNTDTDFPLIFSGVKDYLNKAKYFNDEIKAVLPDAKVLIWYHAEPDFAGNDVITNYTPRYWDGITFHNYNGGVGDTTDEALKDANTALSKWEGTINTYKQKSWDTAPMVVTELGANLSPTAYIANSLYHGIYNTEAVLRATKHSNIKYMGGFRLSHGLVNPGNKLEDELQDIYQKGQTVDTTTWDFDFYSQATALALKVADHAINNSGAIWSTTVTGGANVSKSDGTTMPAIYSQAFKGDNGKNYVVIVNKSDQTHDVTIKQDGIAVSAAMTKAYVASTNPVAHNTGSNPNNVAIVTESSTNPVYVPAYSVMRVEWDARPSTVLPTRLTHAEVTGSGQVTLKWWPLDDVTSYNVQYGTSTGSYTNTVAVNNATETTITGLTNGTAYYFAVYPGTSGSVLSNELSVTMTAPAAPNLEDVYAKRKGELAVEWESVPRATGYKVKYGTTSGSYTNTIDAGNVSGYKLTGLTTNTEYFVAVSAYNGIGESSNSNQLSDFTRNQQPYAPNNLHITSEGSNSVTLKWEHSPSEFVFDGFEDGADSWSVREGSFSLVDITRPVTGTTAKMYKAGGAGWNVATRGSIWKDYEVETKIDMTGETDGYSGIVARYNAAANSYYRLIVSHANYAGNNDPDDNNKYFKIQRVINGDVDRELDFNPDPITDDKFTLQFKLSGNLLTVMLNDVEIGSIRDTDANALTNGGYAGIISRNQAAIFDQFIIRKWNIENGIYEIYRKADEPYPGPGTLRGSVDGTVRTFTDTGLVSGKTYYYRVFGLNGDNNQEKSFAPSNIIPYKAP